MSELAEFLLARVAEDEQRYTRDRSEQGYGWKRALTECEVKRRIVAQADAEVQCGGHDPAFYREFETEFGIAPHFHYPAGYAPGCDGCSAAESVTANDRIYLQLLALPYADHPDYRDEWCVES